MSTGFFWNKDSKYDIDLKSKKLLWAILSPFLLVFLFLGYWSTKKSPSGKQLLIRNALPLVFNGRVDSLYREKMNHNTKVAMLSDGFKVELWPEFEPVVDIGDSLVKKKGALKILVFKKKGGKDTLDLQAVFDNMTL